MEHFGAHAGLMRKSFKVQRLKTKPLGCFLAVFQRHFTTAAQTNTHRAKRIMP